MWVLVHSKVKLTLGGSVPFSALCVRLYKLFITISHLCEYNVHVNIFNWLEIVNSNL